MLHSGLLLYRESHSLLSGILQLCVFSFFIHQTLSRCLATTLVCEVSKVSGSIKSPSFCWSPLSQKLNTSAPLPEPLQMLPTGWFPSPLIPGVILVGYSTGAVLRLKRGCASCKNKINCTRAVKVVCVTTVCQTAI